MLSLLLPQSRAAITAEAIHLVGRNNAATNSAAPNPKANLSAVFGAALTLKKRKTFCVAGVAALCSVPAQAVPVDCWWGDPRDTNTTMKPQECDISRRLVSGKKYLDVLVYGLNKRFSLSLAYENDNDGYGDAVFYHKGKQIQGHWQFDDDGDVTLGIKGYKTHFAFDAKQLIARTEGATPVMRERETLQDTPFRF